jgi:hypothetical protein
MIILYFIRMGCSFNITDIFLKFKPYVRDGKNLTIEHVENITTSFLAHFDPPPTQLLNRNCDANTSGPKLVPVRPAELTGPSDVPEQPPTQMASPADASGEMSSMMTMTVLSLAASTIPQMTPPPVWNLQPFPCVPLLTGKNCLGAVLYPITFSDGLLAMRTDQALDQAIQDFPNLFNERTQGYPYPYETYVKCFQAYMSLQCGAQFPMCSTIQAREDLTPFGGKVPVCIDTCIHVLLTCPGFVFTDIEFLCQNVFVGFCARPVYLRTDAIPARKLTEDELDDCSAVETSEEENNPYLYEPEDVPDVYSNYNYSEPIQNSIS